MTIPGAGGQTPPRPDQAYQGGGGAVIAPGSTQVIRALQVIVSGTGAGVGLFVYSGTPALGNPPIFWATSASSDPYGNTVAPTAGVASTGIFNAGNTIINPNGIFTYSALPPALGGLVASSGVTVTGTDSAGNAYLAGTVVYSGGTFAAQLNAAQINWYSAPGAGGPWTIGAQITSTVVGGSNISLGAANQTFIGNTGTCIWRDGVQNFILPAGGGPFIDGEIFHAISLAAGTTGLLSGGNGMRVKKLPWNAIWLDIEFSYTSAGGTTFTFGSLPDATYYPNVTRHFDLETTGNLSATTPGVPRVFMPTSGGVQVVVPSMSVSGTYTVAGSVMYPTN